MDADTRTDSESNGEAANIPESASTSTLDTLLNLNEEPMNGVEPSTLSNSLALNGGPSSVEQVGIYYQSFYGLLIHQKMFCLFGIWVL
jgi:hypothetical protein